MSEGDGTRVVVGDAGYDVDRVRELLAGTGVAVAEAGEPWGGEDVVGLLVGTETEVRAADLDRLPALRVVATCSVGFDHVDAEEAGRRGVWVCSVPDYCVEEVADHALALVLALLRGVVVLDREVRAGGWDWQAAGVLRRIPRTRLGVVGLGRTGRALVDRAVPLGFEVWATDPALPGEEIAGAGARPAPLEELLAACHAVSLHVALTPATHGLLGEQELALMPDGAFLVDTARPQLVDLDALRRELESGRLGGAALDVIPVEPPTAEHPAPAWPRLIVTPHVAWYSAEADEACHTRPVLSVRAVLEGRTPAGAVNAP
ncbi:MAG TPA: C-terminal binding protein [Gaiellaceae bacterium]|nr:C-terminal binding protein [Gaiellaceae bacterium]